MNQQKQELIAEMRNIKATIQKELANGKTAKDLDDLFRLLGKLMIQLEQENKGQDPLQIQVNANADSLMHVAEEFCSAILCNPTVNPIDDAEKVVDTALVLAKNLFAKVFDTDEYRQQLRLGLASKAVKDAFKDE